MIQTPLYLMGFMACGKSALGAKLANRLIVDFIDLDELIEANEGISISEIFATQGEEYFRKVEAETLKEVSQKAAVISLGGGTACYQDNLDLIKKTGTSFYLKVRNSVLIGRLKRQKHKRPLVADLDGEALHQFASKKVAEREAYYNQADFIIEKDKAVPNDIIALLEKQSS